MDDNGQILYKVLSGLGGSDPDFQKNEGDTATPLSLLCRICAMPNEYLIPIFEGEGQENNLADRIHSHLPIRVNMMDDYPDHVCYQCASTLLAFHDLVDCCKQANITLMSRVQLGQSKKTFTKEASQSKHTDPTQINKERYCLSFRSFHRAQKGPPGAPASPLGPDVKLEPDSILDKHNVSNFPSHEHFFMDESLFPPTYSYSNDDNNDGDDDDDEGGEDDEDNEEIKSNSNHAETELTPQQGDLGKQYLVLQEMVAKLKEHVSRCHKRNSKYKSAKRRPPRIHDSQTKAELEMVKVKVGGKIQYQCNVCNKAFPRANNFLRHKIIHSEKLFPCEICGRKFRIQGYLKNHLKKIHSIETKQELLNYLKSHPASAEGDELKQEEVRSGGRKFFDYNAIERVKVVINGEVFYQCEICDKKLSRVRYYLNHITVHTGEKKFICHHCGRSFRLVTMLRVHMRVTHENIKDFSCDVCPRKFGTKNNLLEHQHIHTGERPYVCSKCGKSFKQKSALYIHNRSHTDHFPFKCPQCESKFRIQSQLNYHMIKHTGETPFTCDFCGKAFPARCHLNQHRKCHLEVRPYPCRICDKAFRYRNNLNVHLRNCHKM